MVEIVEKQPSVSVPAWDQAEDVSTLTFLKFKALHRKLHAHKQHLEKVGPTMDIQRIEREVDDLRAKAENFRLTRLYKSLEAAEELKRKNVQLVGKLCTVIRDAESRQKEITLPSQPDTSSQGSLNSTVRRRRFKQIWRENMDFLERLRNTGPAVATAEELATRYHVHEELVARRARFRRRNVRLLAVPPPQPSPRPKDPSSTSDLPHHMRPVRENLQTKLPPLKNRQPQSEALSVRPPKGDRSAASTASAPSSSRTSKARRTAAAPKAQHDSNDGNDIRDLESGVASSPAPQQDSEAVLLNEVTQAEIGEHTVVEGATLTKEDVREDADAEKRGREQTDEDPGPTGDRGVAEVGQGHEADTSEDKGEHTISQPADVRAASLPEATGSRENADDAEGGQGSQTLKASEGDMASEMAKAVSKDSAAGDEREKLLDDQRRNAADTSSVGQATSYMEATKAEAVDPAEQDGDEGTAAADAEHAEAQLEPAPHSTETYEATEGAQMLADQAQTEQPYPTTSTDQLLPPEANRIEKSAPAEPDDATATASAANHTKDQEDEFEASESGRQSAAGSDEDEDDGGFERSTSGLEQHAKQDAAGSAHVRQEAGVLAEEYGEDFEDEPQDPQAVEASESGHQSATGSDEDEDEDDGGFERSTSGLEQHPKQDATGRTQGRQEAGVFPEEYGEDFEDEPEAVERKSTSSGDRGFTDDIAEKNTGKQALVERDDGQRGQEAVREETSSPQYSTESFEDDGQDASKIAGQEDKGTMGLQDDEREEEEEEESKEAKSRGEEQDSEKEDDNDFEDDDFEDNDEEDERQDRSETDEDNQSQERDDRTSKSGSSEAGPRQSDVNGGHQKTAEDEGNAYEDSDWEASEEDENASGPSSPASPRTPAANKSQGPSPQVDEYEAHDDEFEESSESNLSGSPVEATKSQSSWS